MPQKAGYIQKLRHRQPSNAGNIIPNCLPPWKRTSPTPLPSQTLDALASAFKRAKVDDEDDKDTTAITIRTDSTGHSRYTGPSRPSMSIWLHRVGHRKWLSGRQTAGCNGIQRNKGCIAKLNMLVYSPDFPVSRPCRYAIQHNLVAQRLGIQPSSPSWQSPPSPLDFRTRNWES